MENLPEIPGYRIERELGQGGMATVYLAVQEKLNRRVAIKVLSPLLLLDKQFSTRFLKEAETAANLSHPNIVTIFDVGQAGKNFYIVMEHLAGGSLKERIARSGGMKPDGVVAVIRQIAVALDYAHREGFIHRDIKSDNILFRKDGSAVLTDFGIAKAVDSATKLTKTGMSIGTPHYMSPEQIRGQDIDGRADIYSLGIVFYEMLAGKVPFDATDTIAIAMKHVQEPVPVLPAQLSRFQPLLEKLLAKNAQERPQSGKKLAELIDELEAPIPEQAVGARRYAPGPQRPTAVSIPTPSRGTPGDSEKKPATLPPMAESTEKSTPEVRHKQTAWVLASMLVVLVVLLVLLVATSQVKEPKKNSRESISTFSTPEVPNPTNAEDSEYARYFSQAKAAYDQGNNAVALGLLNRAIEIKVTDEAKLLKKIVADDMERIKTAAQKAERERQSYLDDEWRKDAKAGATEPRSYSSLVSVKLRSEYRMVSPDEIKAMAKRLGIFLSDWNPSADGIRHQYKNRTISGDRVVVDGGTGLMWHKSGYGQSMTYSDAQIWLADLNRRGYAGYSDWRLPTLEEAMSLLEGSKKNGRLYVSQEFWFIGDRIWTGDSSSYGASWVVCFDDGDVDWFLHERSFDVRPVRSGK